MSDIAKKDLPDLSEVLNKIDPPDVKVQRAVEEIDALEWCGPGEDTCDTEEDVAEAIAILKRLGLRFETPIKIKGKGQLSLGRYILAKARQCPHWSEAEAGEAVARAITDEKLVLGVSRARADLPEFWYEESTGKYWFCDDSGNWRGVGFDAARRLLVDAGLSDRRESASLLSEAEAELMDALKHKPVYYCGPLAGYKAGIYDFGQKVLVTSSVKLIEPVQGPWQTIKAILDGMFGPDQEPYMCGTLKVGYEAYRDGSDRPVPMIVLCGPASGDAGNECAWKSAFAARVIAPAWGGRMADAARYCLGRTEFNADLFGNETLLLDDVRTYSGWLSRHGLSETLKSMIVGARQGLHDKHKTQVQIYARPRWRVVMTCNDDDEALQQMPDFSENFRDKAHLFRIRKFTLPMPNRTHDEWRALDQQIEQELPGFIHWLINWTLPEDLRSDRYGVKAYHNPSLLRRLFDMSNEAQLAALIDAAELRPSGDDGDEVWVGTAAELTAKLTSHVRVGDQARKLLSWTGAAGTLLGKLRCGEPKKYASKRPNERKPPIWTIKLH